MARPDFIAVNWLPPFFLSEKVLSDGVLEVTHSPAALRPLSRLRFDPATRCFLPEAASAAASADVPGLRAALAALAEADHSPEARARRWQLGTELAAAEATQALQRLPDWLAAAASVRGAYLRQLDTGRPPPAAALLATCHDVPHALRFLGNALPTAEAVGLLRPLGRICEVGAGAGLFARALERAGMIVAASDAATGSGAGIAFPVRRGHDAEATIAFFAAMGEVPPLLMLWPQLDEGDWFAAVFAQARPGSLVALASPEFEFCLAGGLSAASVDTLEAAGPGWRAAGRLTALLRRDFEMTAEAPVVPSGWPLAPTPLRLWRRR